MEQSLKQRYVDYVQRACPNIDGPTTAMVIDVIDAHKKGKVVLNCWEFIITLCVSCIFSLTVLFCLSLSERSTNVFLLVLGAFLVCGMIYVLLSIGMSDVLDGNPSGE